MQRFPNNSPCQITSIDFDDTGELCLVAQDDETLQIYNCKEGKHAKELKSQKYGVDLARFTHNSQSIIYASTKGDGEYRPSPCNYSRLVSYSIMPLCFMTLLHTTKPPVPNRLIPPPDAIRYLSTHDNAFLRYFRGHTAPLTSLTLNPSNDTFLSTSLDSTLRLWDLRSPSSQALLHLTTPLLTAYDSTASVIAVACLAAKSILLYDVRQYDKQPFAIFDVAEAEAAIAQNAAVQKAGGVGDWSKLEFSNNGLRILLATTGAGHFILDSFEGEFLAFCLRGSGSTGRGRCAPSEVGALRDYQKRKRSGEKVERPKGVGTTGQGDACLTPDGRFVMGGAGEGEVCVWDVGASAEETPGNKIVRPLKELAGGAKAGGQNCVVACNPRFNHLVTADRSVVFWQPDVE